jgi:hypothetical protein
MYVLSSVTLVHILSKLESDRELHPSTVSTCKDGVARCTEFTEIRPSKFKHLTFGSAKFTVVNRAQSENSIVLSSLQLMLSTLASQARTCEYNS